MDQMKDKTACVTGGSAGIGRGIVEAFLREGARVVIGSRDPQAGARVLAEIGAGERGAFVAADVTRRADVEHLIDETVSRYGAIDVAVFNAGGVRNSAPVIDMTDEEWEFEIAINLSHVFWGIRHALRHMTRQGSGRIITMSSVEGKHAKAGVAGYVATKHAVNGLTKAVAKEAGPLGITVNAICPGLVLTELVRRGDGKDSACPASTRWSPATARTPHWAGRSPSRRSPPSRCCSPPTPGQGSPARASQSTAARQPTKQVTQ